MLVPKQQASKDIPLSLFISYVNADEPLLRQLEGHLSLLRRQGLIADWNDHQILAGKERGQEINKHLETASIILLLISPDFLASDSCYEIEMERALERHKRGAVHAIPIILRPCDWQHSPFAHLQCLPRNTKPIVCWDNKDEAFVAIAQELRRIIAQQQFPYPALSDMQRQNRIRMLKRVHATWIEDLLEHSLHQAAWIDLHLQEQPDALDNPWRLQVQELDHTPRALLAGTSIVQVYDEAEGELLILGEPGAGKTTLLLHLARTLLDRALADEHMPVPVVFNLSSWAELRQPLTAWLITELCTKYQVPQQVAAGWIEANQILPLLDGLDEVNADARVACVQAITVYYVRHSSQVGTSLVICCRSQEYQELSLHLPLARAVSILPLTQEQIDAYLSGAQEQLEGLRQALDADAELATLARRPLMLSILILTYRGVTAQDFPAASFSHEATLHTVFSHYVERMLSRRGLLPSWMHEQFLHWLSFIANQLHRHQQTVLSVEDLQPTWLPQRQRYLYLWCVGMSRRKNNKIRAAEVITWSWKKVGKAMIFGWALGQVLMLYTGIPINMPDSPPVNWIVLVLKGLAFGLLAGLFCGLLFGQSRKQLIERVHLSPNEGIWRSAKNGLALMLLIALISGLLFGLCSVLIGSLIRWLIVALVFALIFGPILGLYSGLAAFVQHFVLRMFLWRTNCLPWKLIPFLDQAAERLLLRKVGGGYMFVHRLLLEYLATLEEPFSEEVSARSVLLLKSDEKEALF